MSNKNFAAASCCLRTTSFALSLKLLESLQSPRAVYYFDDVVFHTYISNKFYFLIHSSRTVLNAHE